MTKGPSKQRCIRLGGDLDRKVAELAEQEDLTFSVAVKRLVRQALAQRSFSQPSPQQHQAA
jgi:predicted transcriptional regulator